MHTRLFAATLLILAANANSAPPAAWSDRNCASCHGSANLQTWPTGFLSGLSAGNLVSRLNAQTSSPSMPGLANDATPSGGADRASILQYLIDVRDGRISTNSLAFDAVTIDALAGNTRTVTITNERSRPMAYTLPVISPGNNGFSVIAESCTPRSVPATGSCSLTVRFLPTSATSTTTTFETMLRTATLSFSLSGTDRDPNPGLKSIPLSGTALTPLEVSSGPLSFTADAGATSGTQTVAITNRLNADLLLCLEGPGASYFRIGSADLGSCTPLTSPGTSPNGTVTFSPGDGESLPRLATLTVRRGTAVGAVPPERSVALEGNAGPFLSISGLGLTVNGLFTDVGQDINGVAAISSIDLRNAGNAALRVSSISVAGAASAEYSATGCAAGTTLAPGSPPCNLSVTFDPSDSGVRTAQLQIAYADLVNSDASRKTVAVDLRGSGTRGASLVVRNAMGSEIATGSTESFGNQNINIAYRRQITLSNIGSVEGLQVLAPSVVPGAAGFDLVASTASPSISCTSLTAGFSLAPGGSCAADILFQPSEVRGYASNLTLATRPVGAATEPVNFVLALSADGVDGRPALAWQMPVGYSVALIEVPGITAVGSPTPPEVRLHLVNSGPGAAALQLLNIVGPDAASFSIDNAAPGRCEFGAADSVLDDARPSCEVVITFRPQTAGAKTARLQLVSTGTTPVPIEIRAQGSGPALAIGLTATPASMSLADTRIGAQSAPATVVLSNSGMVSALVTALDTSPGFAVDTGSCGAPPFSMAPNSSCTLSVRFVPSSTGVFSGRLSVQVSGLAAPVEVALEGTGTEAADVSGGGCSITSGQKTIDPTLWALMMAAGVAMVYRRKGQSRTRLKRQTGPAAHSDHRKRSST